jgi:branched-chain amino acid transport system permease protein
MVCGVQRECAEVLLRLLAIGISSGAIIALNAIGVTLVYGVVRTINFAYGDLFALSSALVAWGVLALGLRPDSPPLLLAGGLLLALAGAVAFGAGMNIAIERLAFRPFRGRSPIAPLIATIGISFMLYQGALGLRYLTNITIPGEHRSVPGIPEVPRLRLPNLLPGLDIAQALGLHVQTVYPLKDLLVPLLAGALALGVSAFLRATRAGKALRACAQDAEMAALCGVNPDASIRLAFGLGGALTGVAAFVYALYYTGPFTQYGAQSGLVAFTAAVLGGIGQPGGALWAGLLLGTIGTLSDYFLAAQWTPALIMAMLIMLLIWRPLGLSGEQRGADDAPAEPIDAAARHSGRRTLLLRGALLALGLAYPLLDQALGWHQGAIATGILIFALLVLGLNVLLGFAGLLDLGFAAVFGIGAYTAGLLTVPGGPLAGLLGPHPNTLLVLALSGAAAGLVGLLSAALTFRLRGEYLAIVTLAFGQLAPRLIDNFSALTGGARGMAGLPPPTLFGLAFQHPAARYYLALALLLLAAGASLRLASSRVGRAWAAMSVDELAAASSGVPVRRYRALAFVVSSAVAGMAGALFASSFSYIDPDQSAFRLSALALAAVVIGGAGSVEGVIAGALLVAGLDQLAIPLGGAAFDRAIAAGASPWLAALSPRELNFLAFGLAIYLAMRLRARPAGQGRRPRQAGAAAKGAPGREAL